MNELEGLSLALLRAGIVNAIAAERVRQPKQTLFEYPDIVRRAVRAIGHPVAVWASNNQSAFDAAPRTHTSAPVPNEYRDNPRMLAAVWSLITDGTLIPRLEIAVGGGGINGHQMIAIGYLTLTPLGEALVSAAPDHPRLAGALKRFADRHPKMPPVITARLEDAVMCIEKGLARPAVVMIGLAMECALKEVADSMSLPDGHHSAMARLAEIDAACKKRHKKGEKHNKLHLACGHTEMIRERRNAAAHDAIATFAVDEADDLLSHAVGALESFFSIIVEAPPSP